MLKESSPDPLDLLIEEEETKQNKAKHTGAYGPNLDAYIRRANKEEEHVWADERLRGVQTPQLYAVLDAYVSDFPGADSLWPTLSQLNYVGQIINHPFLPRPMETIVRTLKSMGLHREMFMAGWEPPQKSVSTLYCELEALRLNITSLNRKRMIMERLLEDRIRENAEKRREAVAIKKLKAIEAIEKRLKEEEEALASSL